MASSSWHTDFFKPAIKNHSRGWGTIFQDARPEDWMPLCHTILNSEHEVPFDKLFTAGLSSDYVFRETKRVRTAVNKTAAVYPAIDVDVPTRPGQKHTTPEDVLNSSEAAFSAGADGVVLSRRYSEMHFANLEAAGRAIKESGIV